MTRKKIVIAPDSFKESLTALQAAESIEAGFKEIHPDWEYVKVPMADGGEGTVQSIVDATGGKIKYLTVTGPLGEKVEGFYGLSGDHQTAIIEMAAASGLDKITPDKRNPLKTTTWGFGELIKDALDEGVKKMILGIGGSATNDGGAGMIQSLGGKLLDEHNEQIGFGGESLSKLKSIDLSEMDERIEKVSFSVACDVDNPLTGPSGASYIYGPQKGADADMVNLLDQNLKHYASVIKKELGKDIDNVPGSGAAGGLGAGLLAFLNAELVRGGELVIETLNLADLLEGADLVITGEGGINHQTIYGKTPISVAKEAKKKGIPVIAIAGTLSKEHNNIYDNGIDAAFSIIPELNDLETILKTGQENIRLTARNIAKTLTIIK